MQTGGSTRSRQRNVFKWRGISQNGACEKNEPQQINWTLLRSWSWKEPGPRGTGTVGKTADQMKVSVF